ncbi:hypothetical protein SETIT_8G082300v2 [Setaria italica]|uniref:DUF642 domain-containing protein n=1 Tax=Setaria italica TaxID=4555 RepID=K3ZK20_SETIT|nr:uncharacterized protein LOC101783463 [Setaria italica]RCV37680.1 hypothetical protein SETIT_8G082300v2 [Setaria italica]
MAKNHHHLVHLLFFLAAVASTAASAATGGNSTTPTAYEMLERYEFPRGILPEGVQRYVLRPDGSFEVFFSGSGGGCEFRVGDRYQLRYERRIAGNARAGSIRELRGVSVKVLFVWLGITEVDRAGDQLSFRVGPLSASFPLAKFSVSPRCRCGFDCEAAAGGDAAVAAS